MARSIKRKLAIAAVALGVGAGTWAAAAALTVNSTTLGAGGDSVLSCDTVVGIDAAYTSTYNASSGEFEVDSVDLTNIDGDCAGTELTVVLSNGSTVLDTLSVLSVSGTSVSLPTNVAVAAEDVTAIDVQLNG